MWVERPLHEVRRDLGGFQKFILRGNVVDLAVGVVIGAAFGNVVNALVNNVLNPLLGIFGGTPNVSDVTWQVGTSTIGVGTVLNAVLSFLLVAVVIYFLVVLPVNRLRDRFLPEPKPAPTKECPECLSQVPKGARRCPHCTSALASEAPTHPVAA